MVVVDHGVDKWCEWGSSLGEIAGLNVETSLGRMREDDLVALRNVFERIAVDGVWTKDVFLSYIIDGRSRDFAFENLAEFWFEMMSFDGGDNVREIDFLLASATFCRGTNLEKNALLFAGLDKDRDGYLDEDDIEALFEIASLFSKWSGISDTINRKFDGPVFRSEPTSVSLGDYLKWADSELWMVQFKSFLTDFCRTFSRKSKSSNSREHAKDISSLSMLSSSSSDSSGQDKVQITRSKTLSSLDGEIDNPFIIDYDDLSLGHQIGTGKFSDVYSGEWLHQPVAIKVLRTQDEDGGSRVQSQLVDEARIMSQLRHPNIMLYMAATIDPEKPLCMVAELFDGGSLSCFLEGTDKSNLSDKTRSKIALGVARGMLYLHSSDPVVCHKDLKCENILISKDGSRVVVSDFGLSRLHHPLAPNDGPVGTPATMAPEVADGQPYTPTADVYSFGIVLYEIFTDRRAFEGFNAIQILFSVTQGMRPPFSETDAVPPCIEALIEACWAADANSRPTFEDITKTLKRIEQSM